MGKIGGFLEYGRQETGYRPASERIKDYGAVELPFKEDTIHAQLARCLECGTPFCHGYGCPLANIIPEFNDLAWQARWEEALALLLAANPFPEFTGRLCPAPCEAACVLAINDDAVTIRQIELAIAERGFAKGYLQPAPPGRRFKERVAVVGSGPAGLAAADTLNHAGYTVVVYERAAKIGGILRYGIPDFKFEKWILDRRIKLMEQEGVQFETGVAVGTDVSCAYLRSRFNAICLCGGVGEPRRLNVPGHDLAGIHYAMDYLAVQNRINAKEPVAVEDMLDANGKAVVIIGGGDTGADCLGTAIRQGAKSVIQLEILPEPPRARPEATPWPMWPAVRRDSSSHKEGGIRRWGVETTRFHGCNGRIVRMDCVEVDAVRRAGGGLEFAPRKGTEFELEADMVLLALGYVTPGWDRIAGNFHLECGSSAAMNVGSSAQIAETPRAGCQASAGKNEDHATGMPDIFIAGDMRNGPSLVGRAIADGMAAAREIIYQLKKACVIDNALIC